MPIKTVLILALVALSLFSCSAPTDVPAVRREVRSGPAELVLVTPQIDFGYMYRATIKVLNVRVANIGGTAGIIKQLRVGHGGRGFLISSTSLPIMVLPGDSINIGISFVKPELGIFRDTLFINDTMFAAPLTATVPSVLVTDVNFGSVAVGRTSTMEGRIINQGFEKAILTTAESMGPELFAFDIRAGISPSDIEPGTTRPFTVTFTPTLQKTFTNQLNFYIQAPFPVDNYAEITGVGI